MNNRITEKVEVLEIAKKIGVSDVFAISKTAAAAVAFGLSYESVVDILKKSGNHAICKRCGMQTVVGVKLASKSFQQGKYCTNCRLTEV